MRAHETCYQLINNLSIYLYINCHVSFHNIIYFEVLSSSFWIMPSSMLVTSPGWRQIETDDTCAQRIKFMKLRLKHESWGAAGRRCVASWGHWSIQTISNYQIIINPWCLQCCDMPPKVGADTRERLARRHIPASSWKFHEGWWVEFWVSI